MNNEQFKEFSALATKQERAKYLLQFEVTTRVNTHGLDLVNQAFIGEVALPITGGSDEEVVAKTKAWLEELAAS